MKNRRITLTAALCSAALLIASCSQNGTASNTTADASKETAAQTSATEPASETSADVSEITNTTTPASSEPDDDEELTDGYFQTGLYAAVKGGTVHSLYYFDSENEGHIDNFDGNTSTPFTYEQNFDEVTFHMFSADDNTKMSVHPDELAYTVGKFEESGEEYTFSYLGETGDHDVVLPETEAEFPFTVPGVYSCMTRGDFTNFLIFDNETHCREQYIGGTGFEYTYDISKGKIVFHTESGDVPMTLRVDDYSRPIGQYDGSGAIVSFNYVRGAEPDRIILADPPQSEGYEPAHPFQFTDTGWEMENVPESLMDMNAVAGRNNAFMLQLDKAAAQNGFESHFIFLDSEGLIIADYTVKEDTVEDLGIAPAPMLGALDIVVYPVKLKDILDTYGFSLQDVAKFYITDDIDEPCIELVTIEIN